MNANNNSQTFTSAGPQHSSSGAPPNLPDLTAMGSIDPAALVDAASSVLGLTPANRMELHTFRLLGGSDMPDGAARMAIWTHATILDVRQAVQLLLSSVSDIKSTVTTMKTMTADQVAATLSQPQRNGINRACKVALFDPKRRDFDNAAIIPSAKIYIKKHKDTNGFKHYCDDPEHRSEDMVKAVNTWLSAKATSGKGELKKHLTIGLSRGKQRRSLSVATQKATKTFLDVSTPELQHFFFMLILRAFTRIWMNTPSDKVIGLKRSSGEAASDDDNEQDTAEAKEATDFWAIMTGMFKQRASWGKDWKLPQWQSFIGDALEWEQHNFPNDSLSGIPLECRPNAPWTSNLAMQLLPPHASPAQRLVNALPQALMASRGQLSDHQQPSPSTSQLNGGPPTPVIDNMLGGASQQIDMTGGGYPHRHARIEGTTGSADPAVVLSLSAAHTPSPYLPRPDSGSIEEASSRAWGNTSTIDSLGAAQQRGDDAPPMFGGLGTGNLRNLIN